MHSDSIIQWSGGLVKPQAEQGAGGVRPQAKLRMGSGYILIYAFCFDFIISNHRASLYFHSIMASLCQFLGPFILFLI